MRSNGNLWRLAAGLALLAPVPAGAQSDGGPPPSNGPNATSQATLGAERYDAVGYADFYEADARPGAVTAAHDSLPSGSFAEVTALDSGKTIVVMIVDRGVGNGRIIALSPGAMLALGNNGTGMLGVRVRRVNPLGADQQALREGRQASVRIDAPPVLLTALRKRLPVMPAGGLARARPSPNGGAGASYAAPRRPAPAASRPAAPLTAGLYVQVAALSSAARATALADEVGGTVQAAGSIYRVRLGPFANAASANSARDGVARRGYGSAQIVKQ